MRRGFLAVLVAAISVLWIGGTATSAVPQVQCQPFAGNNAPDSALDVSWVSRFTYLAPQTTSSVSGAAAVEGHPGWAYFFDNNTGSPVTHPAVSLSSSLDPNVFDGEIPSFPFSCALPSLNPDREMQVFPGLEATGLHSSFSLGYDSSRSVSPAVVPSGGGDVNVQFSVTLTDPRYAGGGFVSLFIGHGGNTSIVSEQPPTNLDQGESASPFPNSVQNPSPNDGAFSLSNAQLGKTYVFSAVMHVSSTPSGEPWTFEPGAQIYVNGRGQGCTLACNTTGSSVGFTDASFGSVTTSVNENDRRWNVYTSTQYVTTYQGGLFPDLNATVSSGAGANVSAMTNAVTHGTSFANALLGWQFGLGNFQSQNTVTNPTISVASGYDASQLYPNFAGVAASSLPIVASQPSLAPGGGMGLGLGSFIPATTIPGCDSSRSVTPATVPLGGGDQTFTFSLTCFDPGVKNVNAGVQQHLPGSTVVSFTPPSNLDQGEGLNAPPNSWFGAPGDANAGFGIGIENLVSGKQYTFTFVIHSPNPFGIPYAQTANIGVEEESPQPNGCVGCGGLRTSITVAEPTLDGPTAGAGQVTFTTGEPHVWQVDVEHTQQINYNGTQPSALDYSGPPSAVDGELVTLTSSWEGIDIPAQTPVVFTLGSQSCTTTTGSVSNPFGNEGAVCSIVLAQPIGTYTLQVSSPGDLTVYPASTSAPFAITGPTSAGQCKNGGWKVFGIFKNQGDCVSYVATGGKNPPSG